MLTVLTRQLSAILKFSGLKFSTATAPAKFLCRDPNYLQYPAFQYDTDCAVDDPVAFAAIAVRQHRDIAGHSAAV